MLKQRLGGQSTVNFPSLAQGRAAPAAKLYCCTQTVFFFEDSEKSWTVSMAVCPNCETPKDAN
jgi:hypothetical protein